MEWGHGFVVAALGSTDTSIRGTVSGSFFKVSNQAQVSVELVGSESFVHDELQLIRAGLDLNGQRVDLRLERISGVILTIVAFVTQPSAQVTQAVSEVRAPLLELMTALLDQLIEQ
jgi:hypothetical protein